MTQKPPSQPISPTMAAALQQCRPHFINSAVFSFFINLLSLAPTLYMLQVYGRVVTTGGVMTLIYLTAILMVSLGVMSYLDSLRMRLLTRSALRLDKILASQVLNHLYARNAAGRSSADPTLLRDFDSFKRTLSGPGVIALFDLPWIVLFLGLCFYLHSTLGFLTLGGGLLLALVTWLGERSSYRFVSESGDALQKAYLNQDQASQRADVVRAMGMRRAMVQDQIQQRHAALDDQVKVGLDVGTFGTLSRFLRQFLQSLALGVGAYLAVKHEISMGAIFAASLLMTRAMTPMDQVITQWRNLVRGYGAFKHVNAALLHIDTTPNLTNLPRPEALIEVENLTLVHPEQRAYILNGITFRVQPGELVGVAGASGAGKSTLARLIVGSDGYEIGSVRFDGAERRDWDPEVLARYVGYLPQDASLFAGTIRNNISRFDSALGVLSDDEIDLEVIRAAKAAGVHDMILQLPKGYNTVLGVNGAGLSGGQAQRVALARALYGDPVVLVLDEPNSYQDGAGEVALMSAMSDICDRGGSVIVIAHRISILEKASKLLVLNNGRVQFFGTPQAWSDTVQKQRAEAASLASATATATAAQGR